MDINIGINFEMVCPQQLEGLGMQPHKSSPQEYNMLYTPPPPFWNFGEGNEGPLATPSSLQLIKLF